MSIRTIAFVTGIAAATLATSAAASVTISAFNQSAYNGSFGSGTNVGEDFEALGASLGESEVGKIGDPFATAVGDFVTLGGTGSGGTVNNSNFAIPNTGEGLALRDATVFGRTNTTPTGGDWFLDSNDTFGMHWTVKLAGGKAFDRILFSLSDAADQRAFVRVSDGSNEDVLMTESDGNIKLVEIVFGSAVTQAIVTIENFIDGSMGERRVNDGFSVDGLQVAAVPIPAAGLLLLTAVGGMCVAARRRKTASS